MRQSSMSALVLLALHLRTTPGHTTTHYQLRLKPRRPCASDARLAAATPSLAAPELRILEVTILPLRLCDSMSLVDTSGCSLRKTR